MKKFLTFRNKVKPEKLGFARQMRKKPTAGEAALWNELKGKKLGYKFRRQAIILGYIVDFWCPSAKLVIEVDGNSHIGKESYDARRDKAINGLGFRVLHIANDRVLNELPEVIDEIKQVLLKIR